MTPHQFLDALLVYCALTTGSVTSFGRTHRHNANEGGVAHSPHLFWVGADVVYDDPPDPRERRDYAGRVGLVLIVEDDHDHLQPVGWLPG